MVADIGDKIEILFPWLRRDSHSIHCNPLISGMEVVRCGDDKLERHLGQNVDVFRVCLIQRKPDPDRLYHSIRRIRRGLVCYLVIEQLL